MFGSINSMANKDFKFRTYMVSSCQNSLYDCGMFAIKYMQHWNGATLAHSIVEDKMHLYRLRLVVNLLTNEANNAREKVAYKRQCQREAKDNVSVYNHGLLYLFVNSVCHSAPFYGNKIMHAGTTVETFVMENLERLGRATNWPMLSTTARLGVINRGHLQQGRSLMAPYLPQSGAGGGGSP
ncbi:hypothetical protein AAG906_002989 [Vitis piasezkii]